MNILIYISFIAAALNLIIVTGIVAILIKGKHYSIQTTQTILAVSFALLGFYLTVDVSMQDMWGRCVSAILISAVILLDCSVILFLPKELTHE